MILTIIVACEVGFWLVVALGLAARYLLRLPRLGLVLLALAPVVDLILLAATALHLRSGATASAAHGLAAIYIGISVAYGHRMIRWADVRFAHRFAGGPKPVRLTGRAYTRNCWGDVKRTGIAAAIAWALSAALIWMVGDPTRTKELEANFTWMGLILALDLAWAIWTTFNPRPDPAQGET